MEEMPKVGDIVHYYTKEGNRHSNGQGEGPYPAIVTQTFANDFLNLKVLPPFRPPYDEGSVAKKMEGTVQPRYWELKS